MTQHEKSREEKRKHSQRENEKEKGDKIQGNDKNDHWSRSIEQTMELHKKYKFDKAMIENWNRKTQSKLYNGYLTGKNSGNTEGLGEGEREERNHNKNANKK